RETALPTEASEQSQRDNAGNNTELRLDGQNGGRGASVPGGFQTSAIAKPSLACSPVGLRRIGFFFARDTLRRRGGHAGGSAWIRSGTGGVGGWSRGRTPRRFGTGLYTPIDH